MMKEEGNQTEIEKLEKELEPYFHYFEAPTPDEMMVEETIYNVKKIIEENQTQRKQSLIGQLWNEISTVSFHHIVSQLIILLTSIYVVTSYSPNIVLSYLFCVAPLSIVLGLTECLKNRNFNMAELEITFKHGTGQLFLVRFIAGATLHTITVIPIIILTGVIEPSMLIRTIFVWLIPSLFTAVLFLGISFYLPNRYNTAPIIICTWLPCSIIVSTQQRLFYEWITLPIFTHFVTLSLLSIALYHIISKYRKEYHHGIEYSIGQ